MLTPTPVDALLCQQALTVGRRYAQRVGLIREDCEDCAMEFVSHLLQVLHRQDPISSPQIRHPAWLERCAHNHACNFLRSHSRHVRHVSVSAEAAPAEALVANVPDKALSPEEILLRAEFWARIHCTAHRLGHTSERIFLAYYRDGRSVAEIVLLTRSTPEAVRKNLSRARERLRKLLERDGCTEAALYAYLDPLRTEENSP